MTSLDKIMNGIENENSLVVESDYGLIKRITHNMEKLYCAVTGACNTAAEHTKRVGYATIDSLVSTWNARKDDVTLLPFDYSTSMNCGSWSDKVYNCLQDVLGSASEKVRNLINPYLGLSGPYSTINNPRSSRYKQGGFSLTELLVTISTIGLLMAILMPSLQRARRQAKAAICQSNLHQWGIALSIEGDPYFTMGEIQSSPIQWWSSLGTRANQSFYGDANDILLCPMATKLGSPCFIGPPISPISSWFGSKFSAWGYKDSYSSVVCSYGLNDELKRNSRKSKTRFEKDPSSVPILFDSALDSVGLTNSTNLPPEYEDMSIADTNDAEYPGRIICLNRHTGSINMLFADYSVRKVGLKELWTLKWHRDFDIAGPWTKAGGVKPEDWPKWMRKFKDY